MVFVYWDRSTVFKCLLQLVSNGYVALQNTTAYDNSIPSPLRLKLIAPLFDDLSPNMGSSLYYRQTTSDSTDLVVSAIMKTCLYNFDPLKPHFYIVKLGFAGVYIIFVISVKSIDCGLSLEQLERF